jgi:hypothetical protein
MHNDVRNLSRDFYFNTRLSPINEQCSCLLNTRPRLQNIYTEFRKETIQNLKPTHSVGICLKETEQNKNRENAKDLPLLKRKKRKEKNGSNLLSQENEIGTSPPDDNGMLPNFYNVLRLHSILLVQKKTDVTESSAFFPSIMFELRSMKSMEKWNKGTGKPTEISGFLPYSWLLS